MLAFHGLARVGEVLQCCREDLLLPGDDLWATAKHAFLRLRRSKTSGRGRPKIQHLQITDAAAIALLEVIYGGKEASYPLYLKSPSAIRYRWNIFLKRLSIEPTSPPVGSEAEELSKPIAKASASVNRSFG